MSCLIMKKIWKQVFSEYPGVEIVDYDLDLDKEKTSDLAIGGTLPVVIIYKDNQEVARIIGEKSRKEMSRLIKELYEKNA